MHHGLVQASEQTTQTIHSTQSDPSFTQHGLELSRPGAAVACDSERDCRHPDASCASGPAVGVGGGIGGVGGASVATGSAVDVQKLEEKLRRLSGQHASTGKKRLPKSPTSTVAVVAGQRITEYEQSLARSTPKRGQGAQSAPAILSPGSPSTGRQLTDFPNEILTHVFSHLHPGSHAAVALVSKRFYALITTPHAWRMAFLRFFPGQDVSTRSSTSPGTPSPDEDLLSRSDPRAFARLSPLASWRSEYLLRTRLLRCITSGKPGPVAGVYGETSKTLQPGKKATAVITYSSQLPWMINCLHAAFGSTGKRNPRVVHGASDLGLATASNPVIGKLENWGQREPFAAAQLEEVFPYLTPYGLGDGPAAVPNVMDISQLYGSIVGEGFPGGRPLYRSMGSQSFIYLENHSRNRITEQERDIPNVSEDTEAISAVWMAKSAAVPSMMQGMVAMLAGSTLGIVSAYSLGKGDTSSRYTHNQVTARWALSPGVPIIAIQADDSLSEKRKTSGRVWAVALNALGEVYYLQDIPVAAATPPLVPGQRLADVQEKLAWLAGRTVRWHLVEATRRKVSASDWFDVKNASLVLAASPTPPRSSSDSMDLSKEQWTAEARAMEKFFVLKPATFRAVYDDWDMRRKLEVDFGGARESIVSIGCGMEPKGQPAKVTRLMRVAAAEWQATDFSLKTAHTNKPPEITCSAVDLSRFSLLTPFEDPLLQLEEVSSDSDIPGRRSRWIAVGTTTGAVLVWNMREPLSTTSDGSSVQPLRAIQTDSPEVSSVAVSALFLVHGGSDGLVQAWDPLGSTLDPIRTLNSRSPGRVPRHLPRVHMDTLRTGFSAVRAIFLDPDPTALRGVLAVGAFLRFWSYSASGFGSSRKRQRRVRHSNVDGQMVSRRLGVRVNGYIASETAELQREQEDDSRHRTWMRNRFGVGLAGLTEEEAIQYAAILSQEVALDDQLRLNGSGGSGGSGGSDANSSSSADLASFSSSIYDGDGLSPTAETETPEPSMSGQQQQQQQHPASKSAPATPSKASTTATAAVAAADDDFELQIQRAIRLSLMEGVNDDSNVGGGDFSVTYRPAKGKTSASTPSMALTQPSSPPPPPVEAGSSSAAAPPYSGVGENEDDDFQLALALSLQDEEQRQRMLQEQSANDAVLAAALYQEEEFPALEVKGKGKGKRL